MPLFIKKIKINCYRAKFSFEKQTSKQYRTATVRIVLQDGCCLVGMILLCIFGQAHGGSVAGLDKRDTASRL
jgi:hypothetical protein